MKATMSAKDLITKSRAKLLIEQPFWGSLLLYLVPKEDAKLCPTMGTDGINLYYNPSFVQSICKDNKIGDLKGVLVHEVLHAALQHIGRKGNRVHQVWNMACDYAVNYIIEQNGMSLPTEVLYDTKYAEMLAEEIYDTLIKNNAANKKNADGTIEDEDGHRVIDDHSQWGQGQANTGKSPEEMSREWKVRVAQAADAAKSQGNCPAGMQRIVDDIISPTLNWKALLSAYIKPSRSDYTFNEPDVRFLSDEYDNMFIPSFNGTEVEDIVIAVDTSGSISQDELKHFLSHIYWMLRSFPQLRGQVTSCDTNPSDFIQVTNQTAFKDIKLQGGGGTDFRPVFDLIAKQGINPTVLVYFTDGYGSFPQHKPTYPVLWVMTNKNFKDKLPFGKFIYYINGDD